MVRPRLVACPSCARHVRVSELACPFCRVALPSRLREVNAPTLPSVRLNRAALLALRAGALSVTTAACGGSVVTTSGNEDSGSNDSASLAEGSGGGPPPDANFAVPYGLVPLPEGGSTGVGSTDAGAADAPQSDAAPRDAEGRDVILFPPPTLYGGFPGM